MPAVDVTDRNRQWLNESASPGEQVDAVRNAYKARVVDYKRRWNAEINQRWADRQMQAWKEQVDGH